MMMRVQVPTWILTDESVKIHPSIAKHKTKIFDKLMLCFRLVYQEVYPLEQNMSSGSTNC